MMNPIELMKKRSEFVSELVCGSLEEEYKKCLADYRLALQHFNEASEDYIDVAITKLNLSRDKLDNVIRTIKLNNRADMVK